MQSWLKQVRGMGVVDGVKFTNESKMGDSGADSHEHMSMREKGENWERDWLIRGGGSVPGFSERVPF